MSTIPGNPYAEDLEDYSDPRNSIEGVATLALAYEQRTSNLIALWSMQDDTAMSLDKSNGMGADEWSSVAKQIRERLGL
ncbi:hypothetical protein M707_02605 [Arthrobacter sp. AK-YN10]|nr:hypothetical protein M707_02605 [Arthrobacter sp. AK-YN10]